MKANPRFERALKLLLIGSSMRYGVRTVRLLQLVGDLDDFRTYLEERGYDRLFQIVGDERITYAVVSAADFPVSENLPLSNGALALALYTWKFQAQHSLAVDHAHLVERFQFHKQASSRIKRYMTELEKLGWITRYKEEEQITYSLTSLGQGCIGLNFLHQVVKESQGRDVERDEVAEFFGIQSPAAGQESNAEGPTEQLTMFD